MTRVAAVQMSSGPDVQRNLVDAAKIICRAVEDGSQLVVLPENFALMPVTESDRLAAVEADGEGPIQTFLSEQAREHNIWLVGGTIPLRAGRPDRARAACLLINSRGERVARYDKIHLFDVQLENGESHEESGTIEAGSRVVVADTPFGNLGLAVCYDLRFPELFRCMVEEGTEIFTLPVAFTESTGRAHWEILVRARAVENLAYVITSTQGGEHANGRSTYGNAMIVSPWGEVLGRLSTEPGFVAADLDIDELSKVRRRFPSLSHRRFAEKLSGR